MRILVRQPDEDDDGRLKAHADKLLRRVLDRHCLAIDRVQVGLHAFAGAEGGRTSRCRVTIKLLPGGSVTAEASDSEAVLALYRAADKAVFLLWQCLKSANCGHAAVSGCDHDSAVGGYPDGKRQRSAGNGKGR